MKLLLSGSTGFIGTHLTEALLKHGHSVHAIIRQNTDTTTCNKKVTLFVFDGNQSELTSYLEQESFDGVIHLASCFLASHTQDDIHKLIDSNILFATQLLQASVSANIPWFINTGTFWQHYKNKKYSPVNLYAATKQAFEALAQYYLETSPITFVTIKLSDTFGPKDTRPKIFNLLTKLATTKEPLNMSPGEQYLNINYISNVIDGYLLMIKTVSDKKTAKKVRGKSFVVTAPKVITLKKLVSLFEKIQGTKLAINWGGRSYRNREVMIPWNKGATIPGWKAGVSLEEGIRLILNKKKHDKS